MFAAYDEFLRWYVPPDIITFAHPFGMDMEVILGSCANIREVMDLIDYIESTLFSTLPDKWRESSHPAIDYKPGTEEKCENFVF